MSDLADWFARPLMGQTLGLTEIQGAAREFTHASTAELSDFPPRRLAHDEKSKLLLRV